MCGVTNTAPNAVVVVGERRWCSSGYKLANSWVSLSSRSHQYAYIGHSSALLSADYTGLLPFNEYRLSKMAGRLAIAADAG